ncbi:GAF and ANTAR domain-containing protein [Pseudonocardia sp. WMMC193]|uniref:GAF and ANTAR domain-containing protein n=1 Tax=Pseudonocardia sp. WMMC193 TaxID=2911965 RepID=UPI001F1B97D2|nr:GAF and ANTAR domain-containing protein [Pseudonocardia sp. WMMC193]MCF7553041.1 GAF and ANTAR domain-containing protein [Pseudonocardia sp. WMMC193]
MGTQENEHGLAETFASLARELQAESGPDETRSRVTKAAVDVVDGCDHAAISLVTRSGAIDTVGATDDVPGQVDRIQYAAGEGPCLGAIDEHEVFLSDDLATESRWPAFSRRAAAETGVHSMLSYRLFVREDTMGALNLYSREVAAFGQDDHAVGAVLAAHAAVAMDAARERRHAQDLGDALQSNRRIGMAMGVLMGRGLVAEEQAFDLLRRASQLLNVKLRDIAEQVIDTGDLPERRR